MAVSVVMPALEMAQETGKIVSWLKKEGDAVAKGEPILEIETDKAVVEVESPGAGVLAGVNSKEGDVVPVGRTIGWIVAPGEKPPADEPKAAPSARTMTEPSRPAATASAAPAAASRPQGPADTPGISPKARRIAQEKGVDIRYVRGTGPDGVITSEDVLAAVGKIPAAAAAAPAFNWADSSLSAIARLMAERTTQSWTQVPHFFLARDVEADALIAIREKLLPAAEKEHSVKITHTDLLVALVSRVLRNHPKMNSSWTGSDIRANAAVNISIAMAVKDGVVGAVVPKADTAGLAAIAKQRRDLTERARGGRLRPADVADGTFTITNLGMYEIDAFNAIIAPPQAAILAVGRINERVVPVNGVPGVKPMMTLTLSSDHRVVDGAQAAAFLKDLAEAIRSPEPLLQL